MPRLATLLAATCAAVLLTSSCTKDKPDPNYSSVTPTPSASTTATPSESTAAPNTTANVSPGNQMPTRPTVAAGHNSDGGLAYAAYFWRMLDWAYATNDGAVLLNLSAPSCKSCERFRTSISTDVAAGYTLIGGRIAIQSVRVASLDGGTVPAELAFDVTVTVDPLEERATDGSVATSYPASTSTQRTYVSWTGSSWTVVNTAQVTQ